jgi:2-haloacid dehalogenase
VTAVKALLFDVFGTVVDWRGSLIRELAAFGRGHGVRADWPALADAWRAAYAPAMQRVLKGETAWTRLEAMQRRSLEEIVLSQGIVGFSPHHLDEINLLWRRCRPWPDSVPGLRRLKRTHTVAALSNGDLALLIEMARRGKLPWDMIFSTELFHSFKPHPSTYLGACELLGVAPGEVMMCAAHNRDLAAAQALGLRTAFIARPREYGPPRDAKPTGEWDLNVAGLSGLADALAKEGPIR